MSHFNFCVNQRTATTNWPDAEEGTFFTIHHRRPVVQTPLTQHLITHAWVTGQWGSPPCPGTEASWTSPHRSWNEKVGSLWWQEAWSKRQSQTVSLPLPQFLFHLLQAPIVVRPRKGKDAEDYLAMGKRNWQKISTVVLPTQPCSWGSMLQPIFAKRCMRLCHRLPHKSKQYQEAMATGVGSGRCILGLGSGKLAGKCLHVGI